MHARGGTVDSGDDEVAGLRGGEEAVGLATGGRIGICASGSVGHARGNALGERLEVHGRAKVVTIGVREQNTVRHCGSRDGAVRERGNRDVPTSTHCGSETQKVEPGGDKVLRREVRLRTEFEKVRGNGAVDGEVSAGGFHDSLLGVDCIEGETCPTLEVFCELVSVVHGEIEGFSARHGDTIHGVSAALGGYGYGLDAGDTVTGVTLRASIASSAGGSLDTLRTLGSVENIESISGPVQKVEDHNVSTAIFGRRRDVNRVNHLQEIREAHLLAGDVTLPVGMGTDGEQIGEISRFGQ